MNTYRKFVSSSVGFTFLVAGITGVLMEFFFKNRAMMQIHIWVGLAMCVLALVHIIQNWKPMLSYCRDWRVYTLLIPIAATIAFFALAPAQAQRGPGINPREVMGKLSQASADDLAKTFGKDINVVFASMKKDGLQVDNAEATVQQLASQNQKPAEGLLVYFIR